MVNDPMFSAETCLLSALLQDPSQWPHYRWIDTDLFLDPVNEELFRAFRYLFEQGGVSQDFVPRLVALLTKHGLDRSIARTVTITGAFPAVADASMYATEVHERAQHRALSAAVQRAVQIVSGDRPLDEKQELLRETMLPALDAACEQAGWRPVEGLSQMDEFMDRTEHPFEWVIPGLLERQDRLILIAPEKAGKSVFTRQVAMMLAAGQHPFDQRQQVQPQRTLLVDLENPQGIVRRDLRRQVNQIGDVWQRDDTPAYIWHRPGGIHLGDRHDVVALNRVVEMVRPDLVCISPIYKAYDGGEEGWEQQAEGVQKPLDALREKYGAALWLEHHSPWGEKGKREIRAIGSSRWARWLDYQASLVPEEERPPFLRLRWHAIRRDERRLAPALIRRGRVGEPSWVPEWNDEGGFGLAMDRAEAQ